jgi:hypothetical protein
MKRFWALVLLVCICSTSLAQTKEQKWVIGVSGSFISFGDGGMTSNLQERYNIQMPKINVTRYLFKGLSIEAGATLSVVDEIDGFYENSFNYFSLDGAIRYDFNLSEENLVPYIAIGGSIVGAPDNVPSSNATPTMNFTFGGTYWITHHWGLNVQGTYKYSQPDFESMRSHSQLSAGLVYSLSPRVLVYRLWDGRRR